MQAFTLANASRITHNSPFASTPTTKHAIAALATVHRTAQWHVVSAAVARYFDQLSSPDWQAVNLIVDKKR